MRNILEGSRTKDFIALRYALSITLGYFRTVLKPPTWNIYENTKKKSDI